MSTEIIKNLAKVSIFLVLLANVYHMFIDLTQYWGMMVHIISAMFAVSFIILIFAFFIENNEDNSRFLLVGILLLCFAIFFTTFPQMSKLLIGSNVKILQLSGLLPVIMSIVVIVVSYLTLRMESTTIFVKSSAAIFILASFLMLFAEVLIDKGCSPNTICHLISEMTRIFISSGLVALGLIMFLASEAKQLIK
ncbi:hypothetical protein HN419_05865 [Candidatus Woesearchaeota archaeon]|jgi:hypothetical protein|nr:hypothetical protein [Candidatus Woesearchaeota archaeon]MBT3537603.1 hypothetical protein [Candidatus Woesearchaeota archaeon]MBT4696895.1 hypothetical protein [Candidatus Woesearchaeota archaeon]MBT4716415.1 hypothetical protein [Candidatus Woesearchaeota archaeon]MBT7105272.1 hypothetical protein [Candidatus Woesearchaeota archaeon]